MSADIRRYQFTKAVPTVEIESTLALALISTECLHGEAQVRLDAAHVMDPDTNVCVIDTATLVGRDLACLFTGFAAREFGPDAFQVERVNCDPMLSGGRESAVARC